MEQYKLHEKAINGGTYAVQKLPATEALDVFRRLHKYAGIIGVALGALRDRVGSLEQGNEEVVREVALGVLSAGADRIAEMMSDPDFNALVDRMFAYVTFNGRELAQLQDHWSFHIEDYHGLVVHVLDVNFGAVFRGAAGTLQGLSSGRSSGTASPTQPTSTGGSPSSSPKEVSPPSS